MNFGIGVGDLIQVSRLAFDLYRRCRDAPKEFADVANEVASLKLVIDDVRMTVKEHKLDPDKNAEILRFGQGCQDCLLDLEALLTKRGSLGLKAKRTMDRLGWEKDKIPELRQRLISHASLLNAFNASLARASTSRIEALLRDFLEDHQAGRHEGSIVSVDTMRSIQQGNNELWRDVERELKDSGISTEQLSENKQFITEWIIHAIQDQDFEKDHQQDKGASSAMEADHVSGLLSGTTASGAALVPTIDFPGPLYETTKEIISSVYELYRDAPEQFEDLQRQIINTQEVLVRVGDDIWHETTSLLYHAKLSKKHRMDEILHELIESLKPLQTLEPKLRTESPGESRAEWMLESSMRADIARLTERLCILTDALKGLFSEISAIVVCDIEDRLHIILREIENKERSTSVMASWDELEAELTHEQEILPKDVAQHEEAIKSFLAHQVKEQSINLSDSTYHTGKTSSVGEFSLDYSNDFSSNQRSASDQQKIFMDQLASTEEVAETNVPEDTSHLRRKSNRMSVLFVDYNNTKRSPMAEAYFQYLMASHPMLASRFSRVASAGLTASKPGVSLPAGVEFMLRDYGIAANFQHISRRVERRDVAKFDVTLTMTFDQKEEILKIWPCRAESKLDATPTVDRTVADHCDLCREDIEGKVFALGQFSDHVQDITMAESINNAYWFHVGTKRIYPGFDRCFGEIKSCIADFIYSFTDIDVHAEVMTDSQEIETGETSRNLSDDEEYPNIPWDAWEDRSSSGIDQLSRVISQYEDATTQSESNIQDPFPIHESAISVEIQADEQRYESDEIVLHKHHEQFNRLVDLLGTDIGDNSLSSLRRMVLDWDQDASRNLLMVKTGTVQWVLEKSSTDPTEACSLCAAGDIKCGFVRDAKLEVITMDEADTIANYLTIAISQSRRLQTPSEEQTRVLEKIRDAPTKGIGVAPSIKDDVSVSVRKDKPHLDHAVAKIRQRDADNKLSKRERQVQASQQTEQSLHRIVTEKEQQKAQDTPEDLIRKLNRSSTFPKSEPKASGDNDIKEIGALPWNHSSKKRPSVAKTPAKTPPKPLDMINSISVMFLGSSHLHGVIMAEIYFASLLEKSLTLACRVNDVVSAGVSKRLPDQKLQPQKLERLFKRHNMTKFWTDRNERLLTPEDVVDFDHILIVGEAAHEAPYTLWQEDNPDEAEAMIESAAENGSNWKANFKSKVKRLGEYDKPEFQNVPLYDPAQPQGFGREASAKRQFGLPLKLFEKHFERIRELVDRFLMSELDYDVNSKQFLNEA